MAQIHLWKLLLVWRNKLGIIMKLPSKDSAAWRGLVTGLQAAVGLLTAMVAMPEFRELVNMFYPQAVPLIVCGAAIASFVLNYFRKDVTNY